MIFMRLVGTSSANEHGGASQFAGAPLLNLHDFSDQRITMDSAALAPRRNHAWNHREFAPTEGTRARPSRLPSPQGATKTLELVPEPLYVPVEALVLALAEAPTTVLVEAPTEALVLAFGRWRFD